MSTNSPRFFSFKKILRAFVVLSLGSISYAYFIERNWIELTHHKIKAPINKSLKVMHLTDLHIVEFGSREESVLKIAKAESPDLILISGDSVLSSNYSGIKKLLLNLKAPLGVWSVRGNWENRFKNSNEIKLYKEAGAHLLINKNAQIYDNIWLIGLDETVYGRPDLNEAQKGVPKNAFRIGLFHAPDFYENNYKSFDLVLAGHTHGGQIRLPFVTDFILDLKHGVGSFDEGWYEKENSIMYISRGVGTSTLHLRFLCRPEIAFIELEPQTN